MSVYLLIETKNGSPKVTSGMKAKLIGEFIWTEQADYFDENGNVVEHTATRTVPWDLCKEIYKKMALAAAHGYFLETK